MLFTYTLQNAYQLFGQMPWLREEHPIAVASLYGLIHDYIVSWLQRSCKMYKQLHHSRGCFTTFAALLCLDWNLLWVMRIYHLLGCERTISTFSWKQSRSLDKQNLNVQSGLNSRDHGISGCTLFSVIGSRKRICYSSNNYSKKHEKNTKVVVKVRKLLFGAQMSMRILSFVKVFLRARYTQQHLQNHELLSK